MKVLIRALVFFLFVLILSSCRDESTIDIFNTNASGITTSSTLADLIEQTSSNDGSIDNIIDNANCFSIKLPVTVIVNRSEIIVENEDDYGTIESIFNEFNNDIDTLIIVFPVTIIMSDFTEILINNQDELDKFSIECNGENEADDDIECLDFQYPINVSIFDTASEQTTIITIYSDYEMHDFINELDNDDFANFSYPITLILFDDSEVIVESLEALEALIESVEDQCDEDDDYDYSDDDCVGCTPTQLFDILTNCSDWTVDKLERDDNDLDDLYIGYTFNFLSNGTIEVQNGASLFSGTWSRTGIGNSIKILINIPTLSDFNLNWDLHEIQESSSNKKVDLRKGGQHRLRFESGCN